MLTPTTWPIWLGALLAGLLFSSGASLSYVLAVRLFPEARTGVRATASAGLFVWGQGVLFYLLASTGQFGWVQVLIVGVAAAASVRMLLREDPTSLEHLKHDLESLRDFGAFLLTSWVTPVVVVVAAFLIAHLLRSLVIPPLAWDSLLYHLTRPALWIQDGGFTAFDLPGKWAHSRLFPPLGDSLSAWLMVLTRSDGLLPLYWMGVWGAMVMAGYTAARQLGASRTSALLATLCAGLVPALSSHIFVAYSDHVVALLVLVSFVLFLHMLESHREMAGVVALVALATGAAVKQTIAPFALVGSVAFLGLGWWEDEISLGRMTLWAFVPCIAIVVPHFVHVWWETGSPTYPYGLSIGDTVIFEGRSDEIFRGSLSEERVQRSFWENLWQQFVPGYPSAPEANWRNHVNLGPAFPVLIISFGLVPLFTAVQQRVKRWAAGLYLVAAIGTLLMVVKFSNGSGLNVARYAAAAPLILLALAAPRRHWLYKVLFIGGLAVHLFYFWPTNWSSVDYRATGEFALRALPFLLAAAGVLVWGAYRNSSRRFGLAVAGAVLVAYLAPATVLEPVRTDYRYDLYRKAADGQSFANVPVTGSLAPSFPSAPVWQEADDPDDPKRIAVAVGWDGWGSNYFVYPYFGRRLQNQILYVPRTEDGTVVQPTERNRQKKFDYESWRRRLLEKEVEYVGVLAPHPREQRWMDNHPEHFELVTRGATPGNRLYRVVSEEEIASRRQELEARVSETRPQPEHELDARFGDFARLLGYDLSTNEVRPGETFTATFYFEPLSEIPRSWKTFAHGEGSGPYTNLGYEAGKGFYPVEEWKQGTFLTDEYTIRVPYSWNEGKFIVYLGFYHDRKGRTPVEGSSPTDGNRRLKAVEVEVRE